MAPSAADEGWQTNSPPARGGSCGLACCRANHQNPTSYSLICATLTSFPRAVRPSSGEKAAPLPALKWRTVEDLRSHLDPIVAELGCMPTQRELGRRGRRDLHGAIQKFGGFAQVASILDYRYTGPKSWSCIDDLRPHLDPIVAELGRMPSYPELREQGRHDLASAITKFGGPREVAIVLGYRYAPRKTGRSRWHAVDDLRPHLDPIVAELRRMPTKRELKERRYENLNATVHKFGGIAKVAEDLGYPYEGHPSWDEVEDLRPHLDPIVTELGRMPSRREFVERGRAALSDAMRKFGGPREVAAVLGYPYEGRLSWDAVEDLCQHLDPIVTELGRMPTDWELKERGRGDLNAAIRKFGGFAKVAATLNYVHDPPKRYQRRWQAIEDLRPHLSPIVTELGRMPGVPELIDLRRRDLIHAITEFGGFPKVAEDLSYPYFFAPGVERQARWRSLEAALL